MGLIANVTSGDTILPAWGNAIRDQGVQVCTSGTRPGTPAEGMVIYETDTDQLFVYHGTQWRRPWNTPWGVLGYAEITAGVTFTSLGDITGLSVPVNTVANRRLRIATFSSRVSNTVTANMAAWIYIRESTTILARAYVFEGPTLPTGGGQSVLCEAFITPSAGAHTYKTSAERNSGTDTHTFNSSADGPAFIIVEDVGPNGSPA